MTGELDLGTLLASMAPRLIDGEYVFCTLADARYGDYLKCEPIAAIQEAEGLTLVMPLANAVANGLSYESVFRQITLGIHSSLDAVGLTAAVTRKLAERGISAIILAGYYHDHIFVQTRFVDSAMAALGEFAR